MLRKGLAALLSASLLLLSVGCASGQRQSGVVRLTYAEVNPKDSLMGQTAQFFAEKVKELSKGTVEINLQASGVLGAENDVLDTMVSNGGTIDISRVSAFSLVNYGCKKNALLALPYTFKDRAHFWKFAKSDLATELLNEPNELQIGLHGLFFCEEGFRSFFFKNKVEKLSDLQHKKIRVSSDPIMTGTVNNLGAYATPISFGELYSALQTNVVDAADQPVVNYESNAFNEVAPYFLLDEHTMGAAEVIMTDFAWNKLNDEQRKAVQEAGRLAAEHNQQLSQSFEDKVVEKLKSKGVHFIEVPNKEEWREACRSTIERNITGFEKQYEAILAMEN